MANGSGIGTEHPRSKPCASRRMITRVRIGCITCKKRKVKCDEQKPTCTKCLKYGQKCGGYGDDRLPKLTASGRRSIPLPAVKAFPDLKSDSEQQSFHFFRCITGPRLSSDYDSSFWITTVLRFSHTIPAVRHAVLAVGSLHETLIYGGTSCDAELAEKLIFAFQQYNKAISLLREQLTSPHDQEPLTPLLLCALFVCLEFIQRKNIEALTHLQQGRQLLHTVAQLKHLSYTQLDLIRKHIAPMYMRSGLTLYLFGLDAPPVPASLNLYLEIPDLFDSVHQARHTFYHILNDSLRWRFLWKTSQRRDPRVPTDFAYKTTHLDNESLTPHKVREFKAKQKTLLSRLAKWNESFSVFRASNACTSAPTASLLLLQILYHTGIIWISTGMSEAENVFDEHTERFSAIITLCAAYSEARNKSPGILQKDISKEHAHFKPAGLEPTKATNLDGEINEKFIFSFETGIVPVLFLTAAKATQTCRPCLDGDTQTRTYHSVTPTKLPSNDAVNPQNWSPTDPQHTTHGIYDPAHSLPAKDSSEVALFQNSFSSREPEFAEPDTGLTTPESGNVNLSPGSSANGYGVVSTPESCRLVQSIKDLDLKSVYDSCDESFGIPEHLRISDAIIGQREETGINVTLFRKPNMFHKEWEIWEEFIQVDES